MSLQIPNENKLEDDASSLVPPLRQTDPLQDLVSYLIDEEVDRPFYKILVSSFKHAAGKWAGDPDDKGIQTSKIDRHRDITGNMSFHKGDTELHRNVPRDLEFEFQNGYTYVNNQHKRTTISTTVVTTVAFLGIVYNIWSSQLSIINVPSLHKEHNGRLSIWLSLLDLFGFMVFVCAVAVMILVRAAFTNMQKAMLIFWVILLHLQSANSISEVYVTLACGLFMVWYAFGKNQPPNEAT